MSTDKEILYEQYNNYVYPNPVEDIKKEILEKGKIFTSDPNFYWHKLWPEKKYVEKGLNILVAGCGADQAAISAFLNPYHNYYAVDLSDKCIEHHKKLKKKYNINNLKLYCDDFRDLKFKIKFDYIISTGVIHHLKNPESALDFFKSNLKKEGVIFLMVYGDKQRHGLNNIKKIFNKINLSQNSDSIDTAKKIIDSLSPTHPAKIFVKETNDINFDAGVIDLLLHKQESFFDIGELIKLLNKYNFIIKNTVDENLTALTKYFLFDQKIVNLIRLLSPDDKISLSQIINWNDFRLNIIICDENQIKNSIHYNEMNIEDLYLNYSNFKEYIFEDKNFKIINKADNSYINFQLMNNINENSLKDILKGQNKIFKNIKKDEYLINFFKILIENSLVEFSKNPFTNYLNVLEKNLKIYK